jgi:O-antigen/teichoic acid export membrane protein
LGTQAIRKLVFVVGPLTAQALNIFVGLWIVRTLPIQQYGAYVLLLSLQTIGVICADLGISQGLISLSAQIGRGNKRSLSALYSSALQIRRRLLLFVLPGVGVAWFALAELDSANGIERLLSGALLILSVACYSSVTFGTAVLSGLQAAGALTISGLAAAATRLILTIAILSWSRTGSSAYAINTGAMLVNAWAIRLLLARYTAPRMRAEQDQLDAIRRFFHPLIPGAIFHAFQANISIFLLSLFGLTRSVAEIGALGRLGQIVAFTSTLNALVTQPHFARLRRDELPRRSLQLLFVIAASSFVIEASSMLFPEIWLWLLGPQYHNLHAELPLAVGIALLSVAGATIYTVLIGIRSTRWQSLQIPLGIASQVFVLAVIGINSTRDALLLTAAPAIAYLFLQLALLARVAKGGSET